jgi:hypothetical protein
MCEPAILDRTGLPLTEHQRRTVANFTELCGLWPTVSKAPGPFIPVLQGWQLADYEHCEGLYRSASVGLAAYPVVGIGSVCRRQATAEIGELVEALSARYRVHAFGVKTLGLRRYGSSLTSADSLAWSYDARRSAPMPGHSHKSCSNCLPYAGRWRRQMLRTDDLPERTALQ